MGKSKQKKKQNNKQETLEKIKAVMEAKEAELEEAAEKLAPDFDYEAAAEELAYEEAQEEAACEEAEVEAEEQILREKPLPPEKTSPSRYPKPRYVAKTGLGRFFTRDKHRITMAIWIVTFATLVAAEVIAYAIPETVHISYETMKSAETKDVETRARTVAELKAELVAMGYEIGDSDAIAPSEDHAISNGMTLRIKKATEATARIGGEKTTILLIPGTVKENIDYNGIVYDEDDEISPALEQAVDAKTYIVVDEVHYKYKEKKEKVEATNKVILDPSIESGVEKRTEGNDGKGIFTYTTKYVNGKKVNVDRKVKKWIVKPHDNTLHLGTSATGNKGEYIVSRTFIANCTAYSAHPGAHGALGETVHRGTCAVDPRYVPYRSEMWIEGYGYAYANDCGGAVKNNVVDLFMTNNSECYSWGRRNKTAYILTPVK